MGYYEIKYTTESGETKTTSGHDLSEVEQRVSDRGGTAVASKYVSTSRSSTAPERAGITTATSEYNTRDDMDSTVKYYGSNTSKNKKKSSNKSVKANEPPKFVPSPVYLSDGIEMPDPYGIAKYSSLQQDDSYKKAIKVGENINDRTGMTATPGELPWTTEGAVNRANQTGEDWQKVQEKNLDKFQNIGNIKSEEDRRLDARHIIGEDDKGKTVWAVESPYYIKYGYDPQDPDYTTVETKLQNQLDNYNTSIQNVNKNILMAQDNIKELEINRSNIEESKPGTKFSYNFDKDKIKEESPGTYNWIEENVGFKESYNKREAEKITEYFLGQNKDILPQKGVLEQLVEDRDNLLNTLNTVKKYDELKWEMDVTDEGYDFNLPKASDVHSYVFGYDSGKEGVALSASAFMESPLALKTFGSAIWQGITGDESVGETRREELAQFSLGLQDSLRKGDIGGYVVKVGTSGAMVQGVYLPLITMGTGYALSGLSAGASGTVSGATSTLAKIGSSTGGRFLTGASKITLGGIGVYGGVTTAQNLYKTYQERPEALPGIFTETLFTLGMAYGGYRAGKQMYSYKNPVTGAPRDSFFQNMKNTFNRKIVGRSETLTKFSEQIGSLKEQKNIARTYKPMNRFSYVKNKVGQTLFKKKYDMARRDYPDALPADQIARGVRAQNYEYKDYPDYTPSRLETWKDQVAFSKYLKSHQQPYIKNVELTGAQVDILKSGEISFEAKVKAITDTGKKFEAGKIRGMAKTLGSGEDDIEYSIYKALYSRGKNIQSSKTNIVGLGSDSPGFSRTITYPAKEVFTYRQWLQGMTKSQKLGEIDFLTNIGDIEYGQKYIFTKDMGIHSRGLTSSSINNISFSRGVTHYNIVGSGTTYKTSGNIYSNYNKSLGFFETNTGYRGSGTIADLTGGKEFVGNVVKGKGGSSTSLNSLYSKNTIFDSIKPQLTDVVRQSFKTGGTQYSGGGSSSYGIGNISQYEWYQAPLGSNVSTPVTVGSASLGGYASAYGFTNLATLEFLEEGTQQSSNKWANVKPQSRSFSLIGNKNIVGEETIYNSSISPDLELGNIGILERGYGGIQVNESLTDLLRTPDVGTTYETDKETIYKKDILTEQIPKMAQKTSQSTKQLQKQKAVQKLKLTQAQLLSTASPFANIPIPQPIPVDTNIITPQPEPPITPIIPDPSPPILLPQPKKETVKRRKKKKIKTKPHIMKKGEGDKGLLSDLLSVTRSQARYGTATHPKLSKKVWKEGAKTLYMKVPTKELKEKKKKRKTSKLFRRNKNVFM